jgi:photosystem II stability/assembly factor-like uncharacterized protein
MKKLIILILLLLLFSDNSNCQTGWFSLPVNAPNWVISVKFLNQNTGYWAGWSGVIKKSTDGGNNWFSIAPGQSINYQSLVFFNLNTGLVVGSGGAVIKTTNGGTNWQIQNSTTSSILNELKFVNEFTGWAAGYSGTIIKTTNSGDNWIVQPTGTTQNLTSICFVNSNYGWAAGDNGMVLRTTNGGINWTTVNVGISNNTGRMSFLNQNTGWIPGTNGLMLKTTNSGNSWMLLNTGITNYLIMVNFIDSLTGFTIGSNGIVIRSNDGGNTWSPQTTTTTNNLREVFMLNSTTGWIAGDNNTMLKTTSGGYSLPLAPVLISPPDNSVNLPLTPTLTWGVVSGAQNYTVQISTTPTFAIITDSTTINAFQYIIPGGKLQLGYTYFWRVKAKNSFGSSLWSSVWNFATQIGPSAPTAPVLVSPPNYALDQPRTPTLIWDSVSTAVSYKVQISTVSNFGVIVDSSTVMGNHQYTVPNGKLFDNITYFWRVNASNQYGTSGWSTVWRFTVNPTGLSLVGGIVPSDYNLYPNYPNPFNPVTKIKFDIPKQSFNVVAIYDVLGKQVDKIFEGYLSTGRYETIWNASRFNSGIYFVRLISNDYTNTKKMLLLK